MSYLAWFLYATELTPKLPPELLLRQPSVMAEPPSPLAPNLMAEPWRKARLPDNHLVLLLFLISVSLHHSALMLNPACLAGDSPFLSAFSPPGSTGEPLLCSFHGPQLLQIHLQS